MHFPALLTALLIDRVFRNIPEHRRFQWFESYTIWLLSRNWTSPLRHSHWTCGIPLLPAFLLITWMQGNLVPALGTLAEYIFSVLVLVFSLGPRDPSRDVELYVEAAGRVDSTAMTQLVESFPSSQADPSATPDQCMRDMLLIATCHRYLGPLFWFSLFGASGAATYRLAEQCGQRLGGKTGDRLFPLLNWIPARLTAAGYAIAGNFDAVALAWKRYSQGQIDSSTDTDLLLATGRAALASAHTSSSMGYVEDALALGWRNLTLWVTILGIAYLLSYL